MSRYLRSILLPAAAVALIAAPARAEWTSVAGVPATEIFTVWVNGDTLAAGADTVVFLSTNAGVSWQKSARITTGLSPVEGLLVLDGRLYAGTFGKGVFTSDDLGATWAPFNDGLVGGFLESQLDVVDLALRGTNLYAATAGAGVYERSLSPAGTWHHFGEAFEPNQASNLNALAAGNGRLLATGGANGQVFVRDPGDPEWTVSDLDNQGLHPGLSAMGVLWTGAGFVVGSNLGVFHSAIGQEPWTRFDPGLGPMDWVVLAAANGRVYAALDFPPAAVIEDSDDDGVSFGDAEVQSGVFVLRLAATPTELYAARGDGLWRKPIGVASAAEGAAPRGLAFAPAGAQPSSGDAQVRFVLPRASDAAIDVYDVRGRRVGARVAGAWSAGPHVVSLGASEWSSGVYSAVLTAAGQREIVRLVHVR